MKYKIVVIETIEKGYEINANSKEQALTEMLTEDVEYTKTIDSYIHEVKEFCECGGNIYDDGFCLSCLEEMDDRHATEQAQMKREDAYDASRGH